MGIQLQRHASNSTGPFKQPPLKQSPRFGCAQFVHIVSKPYQGEDRFIRQCLLDGDNAFRQQGNINRDGWGLATYLGPDRLNIWKSAIRSAIDPLFAKRAKEASAQKPLVTLGHVRMGSPVQVTNNHPFPIGKAIMMHNGFVPDAVTEKLRQQVAQLSKAFDLPSLKGTTDTEAFVRHFQGELVNTFGTQDPTHIPTEPLALKFNEQVSKLIQASRPFPDNGPLPFGFNFTLVDDHRILASRHGRPLYLGMRPAPTQKKAEKSPIPEVLIATNPMQVRRGFLPFDRFFFSRQKPILWKEIPTDHMVVVERIAGPHGPDLKIEFQKLQLD